MAIDPAPVRLVVSDGPPPVVLIGPVGEEVDLLPSLELLKLELHPFGAFTTLVLRTDLEFAFPVERVYVEGKDPFEGLTAKEIDQWAVSGGMSETIGTVILRHLQMRAATRP